MYSNHLTIQHWLTNHAKYTPNKTAIICGKHRLSFEQLNASVNQLIHSLKRAGIKKGDKVATVLPNCLELWEVYWACAKMGAVAVPLSPLLRGHGLANLIINADTSLIIINKETLPYLHEIKPLLHLHNDAAVWVTNAESNVGADSYYIQKRAFDGTEPDLDNLVGSDTYNIIYSSGTTGLPKGIVISHAVRALYGSLFANYYRMTPESVVMHSGSIIFNGSFLTLMPAMFLGCTYILQDHFDPTEVVTTIQQENGVCASRRGKREGEEQGFGGVTPKVLGSARRAESPPS